MNTVPCVPRQQDPGVHESSWTLGHFGVEEEHIVGKNHYLKESHIVWESMNPCQEASPDSRGDLDGAIQTRY